MDPISIVTAVVGLTGTCLKTAMVLNALRDKYQNASLTIAAICSECTMISASLTEVQNYILRNTAFQNRPELRVTFDTALTSCTVVFSCLEQEVNKISASEPGSNRAWKNKAKYLWNEDTMREYLFQMRGQQAALSFLLQILQMQSIEEIHQQVQNNTSMLQRHASAAHSLRAAHPEVKIPESIFGNHRDAESVFGDATSTIGAAEFDFDDLIVNSKAYRRALLQAQAMASRSNLNQSISDPEVNLIDFDEEVVERPPNREATSLENLWSMAEALSDTPPTPTAATTVSNVASRDKNFSDFKTVTPLVERSPELNNGGLYEPTSNRKVEFGDYLIGGQEQVKHREEEAQELAMSPAVKTYLPPDVLPVRIQFTRPFIQSTTTTAMIRNPNISEMAYKVKTTAHLRYSVNPNIGIISPGNSIPIVFRMDPVIEKQAEIACKDLFLIQWVVEDGIRGLTANGEIWKPFMGKPFVGTHGPFSVAPGSPRLENRGQMMLSVDWITPVPATATDPLPIEIFPERFQYKRTLTTEEALTVQFRNPNRSILAFSVRTTAPTRYCVRPNGGIIEPGGNREILFLQNAINEAAHAKIDEKCRDRFLILWAVQDGKEMPKWDELKDRGEKKVYVDWIE